MSAKREKKKRQKERRERYIQYQNAMEAWLSWEPPRHHFILYWIWQRRMPKWEG
mgnify:CR=1 FL=1